MIFFREKQQKSLLFTIFIIFFLLFLTLFFLQRMQEKKIQQWMFQHDNAVITTLLAENVPENICAQAVTAKATSSQGAKLLGRLGLFTEKQPISPLDTASLIATLLFAGMIFAAVIHFLRKREILYQNAAHTVTCYTGGDFSHLLPQSENGGLYHLFDKINTMATALQSRQEAEMKQKQFLKNTISDISHQLKTPLAALSMYHEIMKEEPDNAATVRTFSEKSSEAVSRMEHLIKTLLKLTRLDVGSIKFHMGYYPAGTIIRDAIGTLTTRAIREQKKLLLCGNEEELFYCDKEWTQEAIENIVKNALDHTNSFSQICLFWESTPAMTRLTITDNGTGISEKDIHHIFKRFYRSSDSTDTQGVGLGLSLAKSIIEGQGGFLTAESQKGAGTSFMLSFPSNLTKL